MRSLLGAVLVPLLAVSALAPLAALTGCAAAAHYAPPASPRVDATAAAPAAPIERSLFARDPGGQLGEEALQRLLAAPPELDLPARVGVLPVLTAADWRGPGPDYARAPAGASTLVGSLRGSEPFPLVTEVLPIPSGALGMEALREIAARYRLRYLILYREDVSELRRANGWTAGYLTVLGAFFLPGQTLRVEGFIEASLFDVKTGSLLLTTRRRVEGKRLANIYHNDDKLAALRRARIDEEVVHLGQELRAATARLEEALRAEAARRAEAAQRAGAAPPAAAAAAPGA